MMKEAVQQIKAPTISSSSTPRILRYSESSASREPLLAVPPKYHRERRMALSPEETEMGSS